MSALRGIVSGSVSRVASGFLRASGQSVLRGFLLLLERVSGTAHGTKINRMTLLKSHIFIIARGLLVMHLAQMVLNEFQSRCKACASTFTSTKTMLQPSVPFPCRSLQNKEHLNRSSCLSAGSQRPSDPQQHSCILYTYTHNDFMHV